MCSSKAGKHWNFVQVSCNILKVRRVNSLLHWHPVSNTSRRILHCDLNFHSYQVAMTQISNGDFILYITLCLVSDCYILYSLRMKKILEVLIMSDEATLNCQVKWINKMFVTGQLKILKKFMTTHFLQGKWLFGIIWLFFLGQWGKDCHCKLFSPLCGNDYASVMSFRNVLIPKRWSYLPYMTLHDCYTLLVS